MPNTNVLHATTILGIHHNGKVALGGDGQVTFGDTVMKHGAVKIRSMFDESVLAGFAGSAADAFALFEKFEGKLEEYNGDLLRAAVELAKDWRMDKMLRTLEAMLIVMDKEEGLIISGTGDVLSPEDNILSIGSGSMYAKSAAVALKRHAPHLTAKEMVAESLGVAADICIYTNHNLEILVVE